MCSDNRGCQLQTFNKLGDTCLPWDGRFTDSRRSAFSVSAHTPHTLHTCTQHTHTHIHHTHHTHTSHITLHTHTNTTLTRACTHTTHTHYTHMHTPTHTVGGSPETCFDFRPSMASCFPCVQTMDVAIQYSHPSVMSPIQSSLHICGWHTLGFNQLQAANPWGRRGVPVWTCIDLPYSSAWRLLMPSCIECLSNPGMTDRLQEDVHKLSTRNLPFDSRGWAPSGRTGTSPPATPRADSVEVLPFSRTMRFFITCILHPLRRAQVFVRSTLWGRSQLLCYMGIICPQVFHKVWHLGTSLIES